MRANRRSLRVLLGVFISSISLAASVAPVAAAANSSPTEMTRFGTRVFFAATSPSDGRELWVTDGTAAGTHELKDINPTGSSSPSSLVVAGNRLFFNATDGSVSGLWVTDGTSDGTIPLSAGETYGMTNVDGTLFFLRSGTVWTSNGTVGGTDPVEAIPDVTYFSIDVGAFGGRYYFAVFEDSIGWTLWTSNGTPAGTSELAPLTTFSEDVDEFVVSGNLLYFNMLRGGTGGINPGDLWKTNGTAAGTMQVKDLYPPADPEDPTEADGVGDLTNVAGTLYFSVNNAEVWKTNGTATGTKRLKVFSDATNHRMVFSRLTNRLMFSVGLTTGLDLWRSKGTNASTVMVHAAGPLSCSESAAPDPGCVHLNYKPAAAGGLLFFPASAGSAGIELWASNGTNVGTHLVKNIGPGSNHSRPSDLAAFGTKVVFVAKDGTHGRELWISDGTAPGTHLVKDINPG